MKTIALTEKTALDEIMRQAEKEELLLTRDGHAVALVTPFDDEDLEWYAREHDPEFLTSIAKARQQVADGKATTHADVKIRLGL